MSKEKGNQSGAGAATDGIRSLLRLEGLALFAGSLTGYALTDESWWLFAMLFLAPDLTFLAFFAGSRIGAVAYNAAHTSIWPIALLVIGLLLASNLTTALALVWATHIGADRALGYGLKYSSNFNNTHLGAIGKNTRN